MRKRATRLATKNHNSQLILKTIYDAAPISRADIARSTQLTRPTVSSQVNELMDAELVVEIGTGPSIGGKRPTLLNINPTARDLICVDIGNQEFRGAIINLRGEIVSKLTLPAENVEGDTAVHLIFTLIDQLIALSSQSILGIGIGSPGLIDPQSGIIRQAVNLNWANLPLKQLLSERYSHTIHIANDGHMAALAEYMFGQLQPNYNILLLKMGQGIGAGIVLDGSVIRGDSFSSGEVGQIVVAEENGRLLKLESIAGTKAIMEEAAAILGTDTTWEMIIQSDHPAIAQLVKKIGHYLGITIANLVSAINIRHIFISGRVRQFGAPLIDAIRQTARAYTLPILVDETEISYSSLGSDIVLLGCSALLLQQELGIV